MTVLRIVTLTSSVLLPLNLASPNVSALNNVLEDRYVMEDNASRHACMERAVTTVHVVSVASACQSVQMVCVHVVRST